MLTFSEARLHQLVKDALDCTVNRVSPMKGGASTREYLQVHLSDTVDAADSDATNAAEYVAPRATRLPAASIVAMFVPDARPDEITNPELANVPWPFLQVHRLLLDHKVSVPTIHGQSLEDGLLLLEDLGDNTLAEVLVRHPEKREVLYQTAVADLASAQHRLSHLPADHLVAQRRFDFDLLRWELEHFREWGLAARGVELSSPQATSFEALADALAHRIAAWPVGFVHRDYQSRNIMVRAMLPTPDLVWIDFQDALLGPRVYDLVALLNDSYQEFSDAFVHARIVEYAAAMQRPADDVRLEFDIVTLQRKLKDAGRFVYLDRVKGKPSFLPFVAPTLQKASRALNRLLERKEEHALLPLRELLDRSLHLR